jgi:CRP-like cAMP-binding protein
LNATILTRVELFADLSKRDLERLAGSMQRRRYAKGRFVFVKGEPSTSLYVVEEGEVKLITTSEQGDELILRVLGPGESFGEIGLLDGNARSTDAVARKSSVLLLLHREDFLFWLRARPEVATRMVSTLSDWLRHLTELVGDEAFLNVHARLAKVLLELSGADARPGEDGLVIGSKLTQSELAGMIGTTRRSVNKWLGYYQREGLIRIQEGYITLLQPDRLRKHAA